MSEPKGPFDAAVNELKISVMQIKVEGIGTKLLPQYQAAIRVLEAAGRVDKVKCLKFINENKDRDEKNYGEGLTGSAEYPERKQIRALLESLPEPKGGEK